MLRFLNYITLLCFVDLLVAPSATAQDANPAPWIGTNFSGVHCEGRGQGYGPFDYRLRGSYTAELSLVESAHFTPAVENLISGATNTSPMSDIDYTLRAWPNHHRALNSIIRFNLNDPKSQTAGYPAAECYLNRALNFAPKDATARMLYAVLLHRIGSQKEALEVYQQASELEPDNMQIMYNKALLLADMGQRSEAEAIATFVYSREFPLPGLRRKLDAME